MNAKARMDLRVRTLRKLAPSALLTLGFGIGGGMVLGGLHGNYSFLLVLSLLTLFGWLLSMVVAISEAAVHHKMRSNLAADHPEWVDFIGADRWLRNTHSHVETLRTPISVLQPRLAYELSKMASVRAVENGFEVTNVYATYRCQLLPHEDGTTVRHAVSNSRQIMDTSGTIPLLMAAVRATSSIDLDVSGRV